MSNKQSIFIESHHLKNPYFGFGQFNYHLLSALANQDISDLDISLNVADKAKWKKAFGTAYNYKQYRSITRYAFARNRKKYDLWHSLNQNTKIEPYSHLPYLLTVHNILHIKNPDSYMEEKNHKRFQEKLSRSHAITYISQYAKQSTHDFFTVPEVPEYVIYNGNPISQITLSPDYRPTQTIEDPFLFSIGQFTARKNFKSLINMLEYLPEFKLVIAGKNTTQEAQEIKSLIASKNLSHRVLLPGIISEEDKQWFYKNCEAFVFPSLREGFGLPVIEAMRFGKAVFTSNNTSLPEIGGNIARYWDHYDARYMAKLVREGLQETQNDTHYSKNAMARAASFNWDEAATQYLHVYRTLLTSS